MNELLNLLQHPVFNSLGVVIAFVAVVISYTTSKFNHLDAKIESKFSHLDCKMEDKFSHLDSKIDAKIDNLTNIINSYMVDNARRVARLEEKVEKTKSGKSK